MRIRFWKLTSILVLLALVVSPIVSAYAAPGKSQPFTTSRPNIKVVNATYTGVSQPLGTLAALEIDTSAPSILRNMQDRLSIPKAQSNPNGLNSTGFDKSIVQDSLVKNAMPETEANFEGINNIFGVLPPDTQGDVGIDPDTGTKYYIQWVNLGFQVWDVTDPTTPVSLFGPAAGNSLWAGTGTICEFNNDGDPITQFDHLANRWMMREEGFRPYRTSGGI